MREPEIQPADRWIGEERVHEIRRILIHSAGPILRVVQNGNLGWRVRHLKAVVRTQVLFQLSKRKTGINCKKRASGVHRLKHNVAAARTAHTISEHFEKIAGLFAVAGGNHDFLVARHGLQFARLADVSDQQLEVLSLLKRLISSSLVAVRDNVTGERGQEIFGRKVGRQRRHARKGGQWPWYGDGGISLLLVGSGYLKVIATERPILGEIAREIVIPAVYEIEKDRLPDSQLADLRIGLGTGPLEICITRAGRRVAIQKQSVALEGRRGTVTRLLLEKGKGAGNVPACLALLDRIHPRIAVCRA